MALGEKLRTAIERIRGASALDKELVGEVTKDLQRALISSDVEVSLVLKLTKLIEKEAFKELPKGLTRREHIIKTTYDILVDALGGEGVKTPEKPKKILLVGLYGFGKTTTTAKLAHYYGKRGLKVGVVAADTFRPAAYEQLKQMAEKANTDFYGNKKEKKAGRVVGQAMKEFKSKDLVIVDSAGRSALDDELVGEMKEIQASLKPDQTWLVLGADVGQVARKQAEAFHKAVGINGVVITRMDGSAKGGGALAACHLTDSPVYFLGVGEKLADLEVFDAQRYLGRIMGYGDLEGLLEKAKEIEVEQESMEAMMRGEFNLRIFYDQMKAARKMGPLGKVMEMMGLKAQIPKEQLDVGEEKLDAFKYIIDSMTEQERREPELLNKSRIARIAKGSGRGQEDVRALIKHYKQMKNVFRKFKNLDKMQGKGLDMQKIMQKFGKKKKKRLKLK